MNKTKEEILFSVWINSNGVDITQEMCYEAMEEYGRQCFEAAKEEVFSSEYYGAEICNYCSDKYDNFENYINDLNKDNNE